MCFIKKKGRETNSPYYARVRISDMVSLKSIASGTGKLTTNGEFIEEAAKEYNAITLYASAEYARFVFPTKTIAKAFAKAVKHKAKKVKVFPYTERTIHQA